MIEQNLFSLIILIGPISSTAFPLFSVILSDGKKLDFVDQLDQIKFIFDRTKTIIAH